VVWCLQVYNGKLFAGGYFTTAGGSPASYIAAWNGSSWSPLGSGTDYGIYSLAVLNNALYAGGVFLHAGGQPASRVAKWTEPMAVGEESQQKFTIAISPNLFTTQATITFSKEVHNATFSLYNLLGDKAAETTGITGESFQFNRGNLRSGVYVFELTEKEKSIGRGKAVVY